MVERDMGDRKRERDGGERGRREERGMGLQRSRGGYREIESGNRER